MNKKGHSTAFINLGLLLIAAALAIVFYNLYDDYRAQKAANDVVAHLAELTPETTVPPTEAPAETQTQDPTAPTEEEIVINAPVQAMPVRTINGQEYIGTLKLPSHDLELPIISEWSYPRLKIAPCRYFGSAYTDNLIISAHNYRSHFGTLAELEVGETVTFTDVVGNEFHYQVMLRETLEPTAVEEMAAGEWDLTLFTCTVGGTYRVTVRCERIQENGEETKIYTPSNTKIQEQVQNQPEETVPTEVTEPVETTEVVEEPFWDTVPLYFQTDYPYTMYGSGTIATSGCSVTSLAMVATYMTGHEYLPDELARYFGGRAENNIERLEVGSETLQLAFEETENWDFTYKGLQEGKIAIVLMEEESVFTQSQHFLVLTGLTEDGKVLVNDSYKPNYSNWRLKYGFESGFDQADLIRGYGGGWLYDKSAMPEEPFVYYEPDIDRSNPRYPEIELTFEERQLLAKVVWAEARGESEEGQQAVAEVVLNRMVSDNFPDRLYDVIYGEGQFRSVPYLDDAEPYQAQYDAIDKAIYGPYVLPEKVVHFATFATNKNVWGTIGGHIFCYEYDYDG